MRPQKTILFYMLFKLITYAQPVAISTGYIEIIDGKERFTNVSTNKPLPVKIEGADINLGNISIDTNAQHYNNILLMQQTPMNFTRTFATNVTTNVTALPYNECRQVDITVDFDYDGIVCVGNVGMTNNTGIPLRAGDACTFYVQNCNEIYIVGNKNGTNTIRIKYSGRQ
jgi:hypothetical protein